MDLKVENETLKSAEEDVVNIREKMYALHRNGTNLKDTRRDKTISQQDRDIDQKKHEVKQLQRKVFQLEPQIQQLKQDKDWIRHRAEYWMTKVNQLRICFEERELLTSSKQLRNSKERFISWKRKIVICGPLLKKLCPRVLMRK